MAIRDAPPELSSATLAPEAATAHQHPIGTLAIIGIYGLLFAAGWVAVYLFVFLPRGHVTP
jgi:hypothetical protein